MTKCPSPLLVANSNVSSAVICCDKCRIKIVVNIRLFSLIVKFLSHTDPLIVRIAIKFCMCSCKTSANTVLIVYLASFSNRLLKS